MKKEKTSNKEIKEYQKPSFLSKIPYPVKAILLKYWFYGVIFFFVGMGLKVQGEMLAIVSGLIGGVVFDFMYGNLLLMMENEEHEHDNYIIYKSKNILSLLINIVFEIVVFFITAYICVAFVKIIKSSSWLFQEPLSQAFVALLVDAILLTIVYLIRLLIKKIKSRGAK